MTTVAATLDASTDAGKRALDRLATERIGWVTTIGPDGQLQSSPIWFLWTDGELLVYSHRRARRNADLAARPSVSFHLEAVADGDEYVTMEGVARIDPDGTPAIDHPTYLAKYGPKIDEYGWTPQWFSDEYPVVVRITPTRWRVD